MQISARVSSGAQGHDVHVDTAGVARSLEVPSKPGGKGSAVNGGEFLMLALATCYCNDLYREAARMGIPLDAVEVEATASFDGVGLAASGIRYRARVTSPSCDSEIAALLRETDAVAEVHNTLRKGVPVQLTTWQSER